MLRYKFTVIGDYLHDMNSVDVMVYVTKQFQICLTIVLWWSVHLTTVSRNRLHHSIKIMPLLVTQSPWFNISSWISTDNSIYFCFFVTVNHNTVNNFAHFALNYLSSLTNNFACDASIHYPLQKDEKSETQHYWYTFSGEWRGGQCFSILCWNGAVHAY